MTKLAECGEHWGAQSKRSSFCRRESGRVKVGGSSHYSLYKAAGRWRAMRTRVVFRLGVDSQICTLRITAEGSGRKRTKLATEAC